MRAENRIKELEEILNDNAKERDFLIKNEMAINGCPFPITFSGKNTRVVIENLSELTEARRFMKKLFGTSKFEFRHSFYSCGKTISTFICDGVEWEIWLECNVKDYPQELMKDENCKWEQVESEEYYLVCDLS